MDKVFSFLVWLAGGVARSQSVTAGFLSPPFSMCVQKGTEMEIVGGNTFCSFTCINHKRRCHGS